MSKSWIVYGPQGIGKTRNAGRLARALGMKHIVEDWDGRTKTFKPADTLHITHTLPVAFANSPNAMHYDDAIKLCHVAGGM